MHFGTGDALLYGVYHAASAPRRREGALILNPWGWEALRAHRSLRFLADRLAAAGYDTFRFDYAGTGDSCGELSEATLDGFVEDSRAALEELRAISSVRRVSVFGLRLGAVVAGLLAARSDTSIRAAVLWAPPASGEELVRWTEHRAQGAFPLPDAFRREIASLNFRDVVAALGARASIVPSEGHSEETFPGPVRWIMPDSAAPPCWVEKDDHGAGAVPVPLVEKMIHHHSSP